MTGINIIMAGATGNGHNYNNNNYIFQQWPCVCLGGSQFRFINFQDKSTTLLLSGKQQGEYFSLVPPLYFNHHLSLNQAVHL